MLQIGRLVSGDLQYQGGWRLALPEEKAMMDAPGMDTHGLLAWGNRVPANVYHSPRECRNPSPCPICAGPIHGLEAPEA